MYSILIKYINIDHLSLSGTNKIIFQLHPTVNMSIEFRQISTLLTTKHGK